MLRRLVPARLIVLLGMVAIAGLVAREIKPDIVRYLKMREM